MWRSNESRSSKALTSQAEGIASEAVRSTLARYEAETEVDADGLTEVLAALEHFIPQALREHSQDWRGQSLDRVVAVKAHMRGERDLEVFGIGTVMTSLDYYDVPLCLRLRVPPKGKVFEGIDVRIGVAVEGEMLRESDSKVWKRVHLMDAGEDTIDWAYRATRPRSTDLQP